jgi:hypothetical protein
MPELGGSWVLAHAAYGATVGFLAQIFRQRNRIASRTRSTEGSQERPDAPEARPAEASRR